MEVVETVVVLVPVVLVAVINLLVVNVVVLTDDASVNVKETVGECSLTMMVDMAWVVASWLVAAVVVDLPVQLASFMPVVLSPETSVTLL